MDENKFHEIEERIKKLETAIVKLSEETNEIVGVLVDMTNALAPMVVEWVKHKQAEAKEKDNWLYR